MRNQPQLITYVDRLAGDLDGLTQLLDHELAGAFGGVHLLPFYDPIDGADAGFDPIDHSRVDPRLGEWSDVAKLSADRDVMADLIVNHVSAGSPQFADWSRHGEASDYDGMFLTFDSIYPDGATEEELTGIYRPRPGLPFSMKVVAGRTRLVWTTFTSEQVDIDVDHPSGWSYLVGVLDRFAESDVDVIRLDAVGYAAKRAGTSSFMIPETFDFIERLRVECARRDMEVLVEIHSNHQTQIEIAAKVDLVYDFALPPLVLHAIHQADSQPLERWLAMRPGNCVTVLDTHDGIGVVDVGADSDRPGLLDDGQIDALVERIHAASGGASRRATGAAASNLDLYQVNCTYFDALGARAEPYLLARLIQILVPGVPQVYYAGLLAARNDMALLEATGVGRDINRPYVRDRLTEMLAVPLVQDLLHLLRWRTENHELFDGEFVVEPSAATELHLSWTNGDRRLVAALDLESSAYELQLTAGGATSVVRSIRELEVRGLG